MGGRNLRSKLVTGLATIAILGMISVSAGAQKGGKGNGPNTSDGGGSTQNKTILVEAELGSVCPTCATDTPGLFSLLQDLDWLNYSPTFNVQSEILTHNTVYTLDTTGTLVDGHVNPISTRFVKMHFNFPPGVVNATTGLPKYPPCWGGNHDQEQAVNWSIFSDNATTFLDMVPGGTTQYDGFARLDFNVRNADCDREMNRFYLKWTLSNRKTGLGGGGIKIVRKTATVWEVQTDPYGEASLYGQGGQGQTEYFGDFRMPFKIILTAPQ